MSGCQCDRAAVGAVCIRCFERRDDAADLRQQLAAAQAALTAEREAHEQTRAERDRACAEQVVAHACMVKAFSAKLEAEAERDAAQAALTLATQRLGTTQADLTRAREHSAAVEADALDAWGVVGKMQAERDAARAALERLVPLARAAAEAPAKSGDETIALAELIAAVLAAALPHPPGEPTPSRVAILFRDKPAKEGKP
jgi:hypothetical protein